MKTLVYMLLIFMVSKVHSTVAQQDILAKYLNVLPKDLKLNEQSPQNTGSRPTILMGIFLEIL